MVDRGKLMTQVYEATVEVLVEQAQKKGLTMHEAIAVAGGVTSALLTNFITGTTALTKKDMTEANAVWSDLHIRHVYPAFKRYLADVGLLGEEHDKRD
jgi:hypothetical protein